MSLSCPLLFQCCCLFSIHCCLCANLIYCCLWVVHFLSWYVLQSLGCCSFTIHCCLCAILICFVASELPFTSWYVFCLWVGHFISHSDMNCCLCTVHFKSWYVMLALCWTLYILVSVFGLVLPFLYHGFCCLNAAPCYVLLAQCCNLHSIWWIYAALWYLFLAQNCHFISW